MLRLQLKYNTESDDDTFSRNIKFYLFVVLAPPSLFANTLTLFYIFNDKTLRQTLHYHAVSGLLITSWLTNSIEVPRIMNYLHQGVIYPQTAVNCKIWQVCDYVLFSTINILVMWSSFERHLVIFHSQFYKSLKNRIIYHHIPPVLLISYVVIFYIMAIWIYPCTEDFNFKQPVCGFPCYTLHANIAVYDQVAHSCIPLFSAVALDIALVARALHRRRLASQQPRSSWRKYRRMLFQLLIISGLCWMFQIPFSLVLFLQLFLPLSDTILYIQTAYFYYLFWYLTILIPFVCVGCLPEFRNKIKDTWNRRFKRNNAIGLLNTTRIHA